MHRHVWGGKGSLVLGHRREPDFGGSPCYSLALGMQAHDLPISSQLQVASDLCVLLAVPRVLQSISFPQSKLAQPRHRTIYSLSFRDSWE